MAAQQAPRPRSVRRARSGAVGLTLLVALALVHAAAGRGAGAAHEEPPAATTSPGAGAAGSPPATAAAITIDGDLDDWPPGATLAADARFLYVHVALPEARNVQASSTPLVVAIDAQPDERFAPDLTLTFSPPETGGQGVAVRARRHDADDPPLGHAALDLVVAPTVAARAFELRVARTVRGRPDLTAALASGRVRVQASLLRPDGAPAWRSRAAEIELPPVASDAAAAAAAPHGTLAERLPDGVRVVSWNVFLASPRSKPAPFARVLRALAPDVVLLQEWDGATADELRAFFDEHVPGTPSWQVAIGDGWGVAVVARGASALPALVPPHLERPAEAPGDLRRDDSSLRLAGGIATTALGPLCAASLHLTCCGAADSPRDVARRAEARASGAALRAAFAAHGPCVRVVGGDLNLVGARAPLEILAAGLDADGGALAIAEPRVAGDAAAYTWSDPRSRFSPGRLDYLLHGRDVAVAQAFVVDALRLDPATLAAAGIERGDTGASDHLPLVVDLTRGHAPLAPRGEAAWGPTPRAR